MVSAQELQHLIDAQPAFQPHGRALAFLAVTITCLILSTICVGLRIWYRFWKMRRSKIWGWDDILAALGQMGFIAVCTFGIIMPHYGLGTPDSEMSVFYILRSIYYYIPFNISFVTALCFTKTSIGVAILRISNNKRYNFVIYACLVLSNVTFIVLVIWLLTACSAVQANWNPLAGTCNTGGALPTLYITTTVSVVTDAGCAVIPVLVLRDLHMPRKTKYALMAVLMTGSLTILFAFARYPFIKYFNAAHRTHNLFYNTVFFEMLCIIEVAFGLVAGSLPTLGKMFHLYDKPTTARASGSWMTPQRGSTAVGTPRSHHKHHKRISSGAEQQQHDAASENLVLVPTPQTTQRASTSRVSNSLFDEESGLRRPGVMHQISFSVTNEDRGRVPEMGGNYWEIEAKRPSVGSGPPGSPAHDRSYRLGEKEAGVGGRASSS